MKVVATLTTMPDKYCKIVKTLESLNNQTRKFDKIYLGLPVTSRRLGIAYPPVPPEVSKLCIIVPCIDYGPITKLVGALLSENDDNTVIVSFDDDMIYPENMAEMLVNHHMKYPNCAIGSSGMLLKYSCPACGITPNEDNLLYRIPKFSIPNEGRKVDSIYGYPGALYVRKFFPPRELLESQFLNYALLNNDMLMNDDITISGYLSLNKIERRIFPNMPTVSFVLDESNIRQRNESEISYNLDKFFQRMNQAITTAKSIGMYAVTEDIDISETIVGVSAIIVFSILILIAIIVYMFISPRFEFTTIPFPFL